MNIEIEQMVSEAVNEIHGELYEELEMIPVHAEEGEE